MAACPRGFPSTRFAEAYRILASLEERALVTLANLAMRDDSSDNGFNGEEEEECTEMIYLMFSRRDFPTSRWDYPISRVLAWCLGETEWWDVKLCIPRVKGGDEIVLLLLLEDVFDVYNGSIKEILALPRKLHYIYKLPITSQEFSSVVLSVREVIGKPLNNRGFCLKKWSILSRTCDQTKWFPSELIHFLLRKSGVYQRHHNQRALGMDPGCVSIDDIHGFLESKLEPITCDNLPDDGPNERVRL